MRYKTSTISLSKLILSHAGPVQPLCNSCQTKDCTHQIEKKQVSVGGVNKTYRLMVRGNSVHGVVACDGYSG